VVFQADIIWLAWKWVADFVVAMPPYAFLKRVLQVGIKILESKSENYTDYQASGCSELSFVVEYVLI
jgi:hypothetical protein